MSKGIVEIFLTKSNFRYRSSFWIIFKYGVKNLNNAELGNLDLSLNNEALFMMICSETEDHKNAAKAFVNKEKVTFKGL